MKLPPTFFSNFFQLFLHFKQYLWWITPPRFVQHFTGFLFIEEAVQSVAWVSGKVLINCPPPPLQIFREVVKNCMGFFCFVTIKDLPLGFLLSQKFYWHGPPRGGLGGAEPPQRVDPLSSWSWRRRRRRRRMSQKVASMRPKIRQQVALG